MDALSDLLRVVRLSGGVFLDARFTAPWCVAARVGPDDCRLAMARPERIVAFHYVVAGRLWLTAGGEAPVALRAGHFVLLPRNDPHVLASAPGLRAADAADAGALVEMDSTATLAHIRHGGGGEPTHVLCGFVGTDSRRDPLLDSLPTVLVLDLEGKPACDWVASSFRYAAGDFAATRAGSAAVLAKLSELLFIEAVRHYIDSLPPDRRGWLAGLRDPVVGRALSLLHSRLAHPWSADELARCVHLSRSAFADRFVALVGMPPMRYLAAWRMQVAAQRLRETRLPVAGIAAEIGYDSEAAFSRAFKREYAASPSAWRQAGARGPEAEAPAAGS